MLLATVTSEGSCYMSAVLCVISYDVIRLVISTVQDIRMDCFACQTRGVGVGGS